MDGILNINGIDKYKGWTIKSEATVIKLSGMIKERRLQRIEYITKERSFGIEVLCQILSIVFEIPFGRYNMNRI